MFEGPYLSTRAKGKAKLSLSEDDTPIAFLKKQRFIPSTSLDSLSSMENATLSLTELKNAFPPRGPVTAFMASPLHDTHGHSSNSISQLVMPPHLALTVVSTDYNGMSGTTATSPIVSRRFFKDLRGRQRRLFNNAILDNELGNPSTPTQVLAVSDDMEVGLVRPPPPP